VLVGVATALRRVKLSALRGLRMPVGVLLYLVRLHVYAIPRSHALVAGIVKTFANLVCVWFMVGK
jgi:hypothetical protein